jgi:hypothetical protein
MIFGGRPGKGAGAGALAGTVPRRRPSNDGGPPGPLEGVTLRGGDGSAYSVSRNPWLQYPGSSAQDASAIEMALMITNDRPQSAKPASASALAAHLDCSRAFIAKLEAEGVLHRDGSGFDLDASRVAYLRYLRRERRQTPRSDADAEFQRAKGELLRIRIAEKRGALMPTSVHNEMIDAIAGLVLTHLSGFAARCGGRDLTARREIDKAVYDLRVDLSRAASAMADARGEPPDDDAIKSAPGGRLHP